MPKYYIKLEDLRHQKQLSIHLQVLTEGTVCNSRVKYAVGKSHLLH